MALNDRQKRFVIEYPIDNNGTQAAIRAGYSTDSAHDQAFRLLSNVEVLEAIEIRQQEIASAAALSVEWILNEYRMIAMADPSDLTWYEYRCCRHCWGVGFEYQWTQFEYDQHVLECAQHRCNEKKCDDPCMKRFPKIALGGMNFDAHREPNRTCPVCKGDGNQVACVADIRRLRGPARKLYAGIKTTQHGIEVKTRDQDGALKFLAQYMGMVVDKRELSGPNGQPIPIAANISADDLTDDQLAAIASQAVES